MEDLQTKLGKIFNVLANKTPLFWDSDLKGINK